MNANQLLDAAANFCLRRFLFFVHGAHLLSMILLYTCFLCLYIDISSKDTPYFVYILYTLHWCIVVLY